MHHGFHAISTITTTTTAGHSDLPPARWDMQLDRYFNAGEHQPRSPLTRLLERSKSRSAFPPPFPPPPRSPVGSRHFPAVEYPRSDSAYTHWE